MSNKDALRLWLQMLTLTTLVEKKIRRKLSDEFETTLPRFDVMATLDHAEGKITMGQLSRQLLVSKGNVTWVVASLVKQGLVKREQDTGDKRTHYLSLTAKGQQEFEGQAKAHREWIRDIFSDLNEDEIAEMTEQLSNLKETAKLYQPGGGGMNPVTFKPEHFSWQFQDGIATITLNRPEKKNPLTFESYAELRDTFRALAKDTPVKAVVLTGAGGNFCSGGDVHEIIGPLTEMNDKELLSFTQMTGDLVKAMLESAQPIIAAVDGICVGAGAIMAMASDIRLATREVKTAFLFNKVGLAGCDMGACAMLPRIIGQGRAAELLYLGRVMTANEGERWGFYNRLVPAGDLLAEAKIVAERIAKGPTLANAVTKKQLLREWDMGLMEAIDEEAFEQAKMMKTNDFRRAYEAFVKGEKPVFKGD